MLIKILGGDDDRRFMKILIFGLFVSLVSFAQTKIGGELIALHDDENERLAWRIFSKVKENYPVCKVEIVVGRNGYRNLLSELIQLEVRKSLTQIEEFNSRSDGGVCSKHSENPIEKQVKCLVTGLAADDVKKLSSYRPAHPVFIKLNFVKEEAEYFQKVLRATKDE
jgi:hypothetical protein